MNPPRCAQQHTGAHPAPSLGSWPSPASGSSPAALALLFLFPLVWAAVASVAPQPGTAQVDGWGLGNYARLAGYQAGLTQYLLNSALISGMTVVFTLVVSLLGGYAFAMFSFPGKNLLFLATLAILMVPYATLLIPLYVLLNAIWAAELAGRPVPGAHHVPAAVRHVHDAHLLRVGAPGARGVGATSTAAARSPHCCGSCVPAVKPGLITVGLFAFLAAWNDFIAPLILINDSDKVPLPLAVANIRGQVMGVVDYGATEAGVVVLALPCVLLFLLLQRHYVRGFMSGALKG